MASTIETRRRESIPLAACSFGSDEVAEAAEVLSAGGATVEVRPHPWDPRLRRLPGEIQLDVAVELLEALLAGQLRRTGAEDSAEDRALLLVTLHHSSSPLVPTRRPRSASASRSLR